MQSGASQCSAEGFPANETNRPTRQHPSAVRDRRTSGSEERGPLWGTQGIDFNRLANRCSECRVARTDRRRSCSLLRQADHSRTPSSGISDSRLPRRVLDRGCGARRASATRGRRCACLFRLRRSTRRCPVRRPRHGWVKFKLGENLGDGRRRGTAVYNASSNTAARSRSEQAAMSFTGRQRRSIPRCGRQKK
jgi:hypothetical protein